jgi:cytochrome c553
MKKVLASILAVSALTAAGTAYAGMPAATGVNGSLHDMNVVASSGADSMDRVCVFCHTPHNATVTDELGQNNYPLWNHAMSQQTFTAYTWATPNNSPFVIIDPLIGPSRLCLTCHDGSVALDEHGKALAQSGGRTSQGLFIGNYDNGRGNLTSDLSNTHPIGFDYNAIREVRNANAQGKDAATGDSEIINSDFGFATAVTYDSTALYASQGHYNTVTRNTGTSGFKRIKDVLYGGNIMTCASCHEVHNKENATQNAYNALNTIGGDSQHGSSKAPNYFLWAKEADSLICLSCHVK